LKSRAAGTGAAELGVVYACPIEQIDALLPAVAPLATIAPQPPGSVFDPIWYIHRELPERVLLNCLNLAGAPAVVWGPELMGKTTLIKWVLNHARQEDLQAGNSSQIVEINFQTFPKDAFSSLDALLYHFGSRAILSAQGVQQWLETAWKRPGDPLEKLDWLLRERLLPAKPGRFILSVESADVLHNCACQDEFFALLRGWAQDADNPRLSQLRLVLAISTTPTLLTNKITQSPFFAAATIVRLDDFSHAELNRLADLYGLEPSEAELSMLTDLVGGHPFLVRLAMYSAAIRGIALADVLRTDLDLVFGEFAYRVQERLRQHDTLLAVLGDIFRKSPRRLPPDAIYQLLNAGLIRRDGNAYMLRYKLYETFLGDMF
jgi:hypothetical protein